MKEIVTKVRLRDCLQIERRNPPQIRDVSDRLGNILEYHQV